MTRASHTKQRIVSAYNRLVATGPKARPPISQLLKEAGVARSTLYEHFDDREALLLEAMHRALIVIADEITAQAAGQRLTALLQHFWDQRHGRRDVLTGAFAERLVRALSALIAERAPELNRNGALRIAHTQIALVHLWLSGATPDTAPDLAATMIAVAKAQRAVFNR